MADVRIGGSDELNALSARLLSAAGSDVFVRAAGEAMQSVVPELVDAARDGATRLPKRGGLAAQVARTRITFKVSARGGSVSIRIVAAPNAVADPGSLDRGRTRHLTWGHKPWHIQLVSKGWFSEPIRSKAPRVRAKVVDSIRDALRKV